MTVSRSSCTGLGEKEKKCTTECKSQRRLDEKAPWALNYGSEEEEVLRKGGGEEARSVRCNSLVLVFFINPIWASKVDPNNFLLGLYLILDGL